MKKSLFLILTIISFFIFTDKVSALSFNYKGIETEVTRENYIYYIYQEYTSYFEDYNYFIVTEDFTDWNRIVFYFFNNFKSATNKDVNFCTGDNSGIRLIFNTSFLYQNSQTECFFQFPGGIKDIYTYSNLTFTYSSNTFTSNITKEELKNNIAPKMYTIYYYLNDELYKTIEVEEGTSHELINYDYNKSTHIFSGWHPDPDVDLTNITSNITIKATLEEKEVLPVYIEFPINKTEFYALLVEVGVLIMIIFLKWCFPFKGGSDLK